MANKPSLPRRVGRATLSSFAFILLIQTLGGGQNANPKARVFDVGTYRLEVAPDRGWESEAKPELGCVLFQFTDKPALTTAATIGLFRVVVPAAARAGDRWELAGAYATYDASGAQQALFKGNAQLQPLSKKTKSINGGELFAFAEPLDAKGVRVNSTRFIRGWVFFPKSYPADGALFLVLGKQDSNMGDVRPSELSWVEEIIGGIRPR